jgi:tripartite-type tricarboxylate transporter receptor subunit TctC
MMKTLSRRRSLLSLGAVCAVPAIVPSYGFAQSGLPDKALRILVGFAAGGGAELMARIIAPQLERRLGRRVSVENKQSDTGAAAGEFLKKSLSDGSVVAFLPSTTLASKLAGTPFPFDSKSTLVPLTVAGTFQVATAVSAKIGVSTFAEYVAWLKAGPPERARLGTTATDTYLKIYGMMIGRELGVSLETIPHRGAAPLVLALKAGTLPAGLGSVTALLQHNLGIRVKILATSGGKRVSVLRNVPTAVELGYPNLELDEWYGFFASSDSPSPILAAWSRQLRAVLEEDEVIAALARLGLDVKTSTQEEATARLAAHQQAWKARMESFGMKPAN